MGHDTQTPLLGNDHQQPSAPPAYTHGYPHIPAPGTPPPSTATPAVGFPTLPPELQHVAAPPPLQPPTISPAVAVVEHHAYIHASDDSAGNLSACPHLHPCPACQSCSPTLVRRENGFCAWLSAVALCWIFCPLFWLPFCLDCDKDLVHRCSVCGSELARMKPWK